MGTLVNCAGLTSTEDQGVVEDVLGRGAKVLVGAEKLEGFGYFCSLKVLDDVPQDATLLKKEIFDPDTPSPLGKWPQRAGEVDAEERNFGSGTG